MRTIIKSLAWMLIIWGALGLAANGNDLYTSASSDKTDLYKVMALHVLLIAAGFFIKKKAARQAES